jgi:superfamily II DNA or RNA helicase
MTSAPVEAPPRPVLANGRLYFSPLGLFGFQAEAVAQAYFAEGLVAVMDCGTGKTHVSMALAAKLVENDQVDLVIHVAQKNKIDKSEFPADWAQFTALRTHVHHGQNRAKRLAKAQLAGRIDVLLTTYETGREDLVTFTGRSGRARTDGALMSALNLREQRVLWIFDEISKLGNRGSKLYRAYEHVLDQQRSGPHPPRVLGLSATPMSTDYEQPFNIGRIVWPAAMPSVGLFEDAYTYGRDEHGRYLYKRGAREWFATVFEPLVYRKRRTDPDVVAQMPALMEKIVPVDLSSEHLALYEAVGDLYGEDPTPRQADQLLMAQRLVAGHPRALLRSGSELAKAAVATLGADYLHAIVSGKTTRLIELLGTLRDQGDRALVYTFFAETVLPEVATDLRAAGLRVGTYTGAQSGQANEAAKSAFRTGTLDVLVSSDAGSTGLNLPEAGYIIEYDGASTYALRTQRFGRGQRITSERAHVYGLTLVARRTVEVGLLYSMLKRNSLQDDLVGDRGARGHLDAHTRRDAFRATLRT